MKKTYIDTAMERIAPDLILKGGNVVDVFSGRVIKADVIIKDLCWKCNRILDEYGLQIVVRP